MEPKMIRRGDVVRSKGGKLFRVLWSGETDGIRDKRVTLENISDGKVWYTSLERLRGMSGEIVEHGDGRVLSEGDLIVSEKSWLNREVKKIGRPRSKFWKGTRREKDRSIGMVDVIDGERRREFRLPEGAVFSPDSRVKRVQRKRRRR